MEITRKGEKTVFTFGVADVIAEWIKNKCLYGDYRRYKIDFGLDSYVYFEWEKEEDREMRETTYTYYLNIWFSDTNCPKGHIKNPSVEKIKEIILAQFGVYEEDIEEINVDKEPRIVNVEGLE